MTRISDLNRPQNRLEPIEGTIQKVGDIRIINLKTGDQAQVSDVVIRDDSGAIDLTLWDEQIKTVKVGSVIRIENGYVSTFKGKHSLNIGRYGKLVVLKY